MNIVDKQRYKLLEAIDDLAVETLLINEWVWVYGFDYKGNKWKIFRNPRTEPFTFVPYTVPPKTTYITLNGFLALVVGETNHSGIISMTEATKVIRIQTNRLKKENK